MRGALPGWSAVAANDGAYLDPPVVRPLALSALHYLVERDGFESWLRVLDASAEARSWSQAIEEVYGLPVDALDAAWQSWLQGYLDGGWQSHALYAPDLERAHSLIAFGDAAQALGILEPALPLVALIDPVGSQAVQVLLAAAYRSESSIQALTDGAAALAAGDFEGAGRLADFVLSDANQTATRIRVARDLAERARLAGRARDRARAAAALPAWRSFEARALAAAAAADFTRVGSDVAAARAAETLALANRRLRPAGGMLIAAGVTLLVWNGLARRRDARCAT
jgi:hypothetical protein